MLHILKLLIPAIAPSWNFFDIITASPRIQFALLESENEIPSQWIEFRPHPTHLTFLQMLGRLLWNAKWNETMFTIGCAERLLINPTKHSEDEILFHIYNDLKEMSSSIDFQNAAYLQFRIVLIERQGEELKQTIGFHSRIDTLPEWNKV